MEINLDCPCTIITILASSAFCYSEQILGTGTFHQSGSAFIKSCATAREEYLANWLVGTCCRHRAP